MSGIDKFFSNKYFWSLVLAIILVICLIMEYQKPNLHNLNKNVRYYDNQEPTSKVIISEKLKDPNTLEQEMVNNMNEENKKDHPKLSPRYHPLLPNSAGASLVE